MREIRAGETSTFTEVARKIGSPKAIRAIGNACLTNGFAIAVPCHRVLRKGILLSREAEAGGTPGKQRSHIFGTFTE